MNIRSLSNPAQVLAQEKVEGQKRDIRSSETADRDANGQQTFGGNENSEPLSEEELEKVLKKIRSHSGIQANGLQVELIQENNRPWVVVKDPDGKPIKKIGEAHLRQYLQQDDDESFSLVRKTA